MTVVSACCAKCQVGHKKKISCLTGVCTHFSCAPISSLFFILTAHALVVTTVMKGPGRMISAKSIKSSDDCSNRSRKTRKSLIHMYAYHKIFGHPGTNRMSLSLRRRHVAAEAHIVQCFCQLV